MTVSETIKSEDVREILKGAVKAVDESLPEDKSGAILSLRYGLFDAEKNGFDFERHPKLKTWHDAFEPIEGDWINLSKDEVKRMRDLIEEKLEGADSE